MIVLAYIAIALIIIPISKNKFGKWVNIVSIFTGSWIAVLLVSMLGMYDLRKPSAFIHYLSIMFILSSCITMLVAMRGKRAGIRVQTNYDSEKHDNLVTSGVQLIQIISLILISILFFRSLRILFRTGSISAVRSAFYGEEYSGQYVFSFLFRQVPTGMIEGLIIYYTYIAFAYQKPKKMLASVFNVLIVTITSGGRYEIILFILITVMVLLIGGAHVRNYTLSWVRNNKRLLFTLLSILVIVAIYITLTARNGGFFKGIISYSAGSLSFLDYIFEHPNSFGLDERLHGYMTFGAIIEPIVLFLKYIGVTSIKTPSWYFNYHCQPFFNIATGGSRLYFNNNTSILFFLYYDFGAIGAVVGGIWMGALMSCFHNKMVKNNLLSSLLYIYFGSILLLTPMYYKFFNCNAIFTLIALYVCSRQVRIVLGKGKVKRR